MRSRRLVIALALPLLLTLAAVAHGQAWRGQGRIQGTVTDIDGHPVAGATVSLRSSGGRAGGPPSSVTDSKGRWAFLGLAGGRWRIEVRAEGYLTSAGWVTVADQGPSPNLAVMVRSLRMVPSAFYEGNSSTILAWLERGNTLLNQGRYAEARAEYEKALPVLPEEERPRVLRSVARTYYMEGKQDEAVTALERAVLADPSDASSRKLLTTLMDELGRGREARSWLKRLTSEGVEKMRAELGAVGQTASPRDGAPEAPAKIQAEPTRANRVGRYATIFTERSPLSTLAVIAARYELKASELEGSEKHGPGYVLAKETFEVVVPETYRPGKPAALLVWVSPTPSGGIATPALLEVLAERGILWVGANHSGNRRSLWARLGLALDAAYNMQRLYNIDPDRIYVAGYSGGGRVASALGVLFTGVFHGALCLMGVSYYHDVSIPYRPGAYWKPGYPQPPHTALERAEKRNRYVLVTGELDFNRVQTRVYAERLRQDGFRHVTYLEVPGGSHYTRLPPDLFARALDALDGRGD